MNAQDKKEIRQIFNEGLEQLVLPILDDIYEKMVFAAMIKPEQEDIKLRFVQRAQSFAKSFFQESIQ